MYNISVNKKRMKPVPEWERISKWRILFIYFKSIQKKKKITIFLQNVTCKKLHWSDIRHSKKNSHSSSSISTYEQYWWNYHTESICTTSVIAVAVTGQVNQSSLKNLSVPQTGLRPKTVCALVRHCLFISVHFSHMTARFCCLAFLNLCCSKQSSRRATQTCL